MRARAQAGSLQLAVADFVRPAVEQLGGQADAVGQICGLVLVKVPPAGQRAVQPGGGFVCEHYRRVPGQCRRHADPLRHPPGQLMRVAVQHITFQSSPHNQPLGGIAIRSRIAPGSGPRPPFGSEWRSVAGAVLGEHDRDLLHRWRPIEVGLVGDQGHRGAFAPLCELVRPSPDRRGVDCRVLQRARGSQRLSRQDAQG